MTTSADSLDAVSAALGMRRTEANAPSYAEIARRIAVLRADGTEPAKVTVYDCFRPGRRRLDATLVAEIVRALGGDAAEASRWRDRVRVLNGDRVGVHVEIVVGARDLDVVGRERVVAAIPADADVIVLSGLPGVGKSALASAVAGSAEAVTIELRGSDLSRPVPAPVDVLRRMLGALGARVAGYDVADLRARLVPLLAGRVVVLEDVGTVSSFAPLIIPGARTVVTSRAELPRLRAHPAVLRLRVAEVAVPPLDDAAAEDLLTRLLDGRHDALARRLSRMSGGLPLEILMLGATVRTHPEWSIDDMVAWFEHEPLRVRMRPVLDAAFDAMDPADRAALSALALIEREIDAGIVETALGAGGAGALVRLRERHLVTPVGTRVRLHDVVFTAARDRAMIDVPRSVRAETVTAFADAVLERLTADDTYAAREVGTLTAVAVAAHEHGLDAATEQLALGAHPGLVLWGSWLDSFRLHDLASQGAVLAHPFDVALHVASAAMQLGRYDQALMTLHRVRRVATGLDLARTWNQIGNIQKLTSSFDDAIAAFETAIALAHAADSPMYEGRARANHADVLRLLGRYTEAETGYQRALDLVRPANDVAGVDLIRSNRTLMYISQGRFEEADAELTDLIATSDRPLLHGHLYRAFAAEARGDDAAARAELGLLQPLVDAAGDYVVAAEATVLRATLDARAGRIDEAIAIVRKVRADVDRSGSMALMTEITNALAELELLAGLLDDADRHAVEARDIAEATGDLADLARSHITRGLVAAARGDQPAADELGRAGRAQYRAIGHRLG